MILASLSPGMSATTETNARTSRDRHLRRVAYTCAMAALLTTAAASAQVIMIDTSGKTKPTANAPVDRRYAQIAPTKIPLPTAKLDEKSRIELIRVLQSEQGFAMRPFPRGHKGLTLVANGKLEPAGEAYLNMVINNGTSAKPGDRLVMTDVKIEHAKIIFELNGGPDFKHRFLRHISIGMGGPDMDAPVVQDNGEEPVGARLTLAFDGPIPAADRRAGEGAARAADLLRRQDAHSGVHRHASHPAERRHSEPSSDGGDEHRHGAVRQGRSRRPSPARWTARCRLRSGSTASRPQEVDFVRINGNRVIRVEIAKVGEPPVIFTEDVVSGLMRTDGTPVDDRRNAYARRKRGRRGARPRQRRGRAAAQPSQSRRKASAAIRTSDRPTSQKNVGVMKPVQFPKPEARIRSPAPTLTASLIPSPTPRQRSHRPQRLRPRPSRRRRPPLVPINPTDQPARAAELRAWLPPCANRWTPVAAPGSPNCSDPHPPALRRLRRPHVNLNQRVPLLPGNPIAMRGST